MLPRALPAIVVLVLLAAGLAWAVSLAPDADGSAGSYPVHVVGPEGPLANGTVTVDGDAATPLGALQALARRSGFAVEIEKQPWVGGGCTQHYVLGIAGHRETGTGGWNYYVRGVGGDWAWKSAGAACLGLEGGDEVAWCWVEPDEVCRHLP